MVQTPKHWDTTSLSKDWCYAAISRQKWIITALLANTRWEEHWFMICSLLSETAETTLRRISLCWWTPHILTTTVTASMPYSTVRDQLTCPTETNTRTILPFPLHGSFPTKHLWKRWHRSISSRFAPLTVCPDGTAIWATNYGVNLMAAAVPVITSEWMPEDSPVAVKAICRLSVW